MSRPRRVRIGGSWVPIKYVKNLGRFREYGYRISGYYTRKGGVKIVDGQVHFNERATVMHELMHALWDRSGLGEHLSQKTEELVLFVLDGWIVKMLQDNPELVKYLTEKET